MVAEISDWIMHLYKQSVDFETFLCGNIEMKTHWGLQTTVTQEIILPWWDSKHRNVGKIPQKICQNILPYIVWLTVDKCSVHVIDGASFSGICILNCQGCLKLCFLLSICENNLFTVKNCRDLKLVRIYLAYLTLLMLYLYVSLQWPSFGPHFGCMNTRGV